MKARRREAQRTASTGHLEDPSAAIRRLTELVLVTIKEIKAGQANHKTADRILEGRKLFDNDHVLRPLVDALVEMTAVFRQPVSAREHRSVDTVRLEALVIEAAALYGIDLSAILT